MNNPRVLLTIFAKPKPTVFESFRSFHVSHILRPRQLKYGYSKDADNSLFFTNLPKKKVKNPKIKPKKLHTNVTLIECKHKSLNHYLGMTYSAFDTVPLASKGWHNSKSHGNFFTILPSTWVSYKHPAFVTKHDLPDTFEACGIRPELIKQLNKINVFCPTVIQAKAIKHLLKGSNIFFSAECGSGKTVAYVTAMIENILKWKEHMSSTFNAPIGIILLPTRELAVQVGVVADKLGTDLGVNCQTLIGGSIRELMLNPEMVHVDILICTLKVFMKHLKAKLYSTTSCKHLVVDEVDTFLEKSFENEFKSFFHELKLDFTGLTGERLTNQSAQICFTSATVPKNVEESLFELIKGNNMEVETSPYLHKTISFAKQEFKRVLKNERPQQMLRIVTANVKANTPTIIFSNKIKTAFWVAKFLKENEIDCGLITADVYAEDRLKNFRNFEAGITKIISTTDLASRGLSFSKVKHVINYEFPSFMSDYIHRCGRTGRIDQGQNCVITNFICSKHEIYLLHQIELAARTNTPLPHVHKDRVKVYGQTLRMKNKEA